jgi:hypothetical protein
VPRRIPPALWVVPFAVACGRTGPVAEGTYTGSSKGLYSTALGASAASVVDIQRSDPVVVTAGAAGSVGIKLAGCSLVARPAAGQPWLVLDKQPCALDLDKVGHVAFDVVGHVAAKSGDAIEVALDGQTADGAAQITLTFTGTKQ